MDILKSILKFLTSIPGLVSTGLFLIGAVSWYNAQVIKGYNKKQAKERLEVNVERLIVYQKADSLAKVKQEKRIDSLINIFDIVRGEIGNIKTVQGNLQTYMANKVATKAGLQEVINVFNAEKKKNGTSLLLIPLRPSDPGTR